MKRSKKSSPKRNESQYKIDIETAQSPIIGDNAHVEQHFHPAPANTPQITYWVDRPASIGNGFIGREDDLKAVTTACHLGWGRVWEESSGC
jgi:hypothetical protein